MPASKFIGILGALVSSAYAHGTVSGIVAGGSFFQGYDPSFQFQNPPPTVAGWTTDYLDNGFVAVSDYADENIICHKGASPAGTSVPVVAGDSIELQWTTWPESHHGPIIDYLAPCNGDCSQVSKTELEFTKISGVGPTDGSSNPGTWATDDLIANDNTWVLTIPASIAPGNYVLRHEIIALHEGNQEGGAQNYPQCINLEITGSGTNTLPSGTLGIELYTATDPGIFFNIYSSDLDTYEVPGPALLAGGSSGDSSGDGDNTGDGAEDDDSDPADDEEEPTSCTELRRRFRRRAGHGKNKRIVKFTA
ncbi:glycosyl hydrolase family 61-domain-containing protein [Lineolata rhizophorae]|uniref:Glycosyl hydrolase family 61-domain-containing protein n=1 Tax=Lineolata rhizophorae TaxID=578093 RepID=A0A6A6NT50_9PEZI|nr:glycosyl hydrolase family 61-domain-containing protein [Lineolata rhizophorae]